MHHRLNLYSAYCASQKSPLTYLLPYAFGLGTSGVFLAEPVSNPVDEVLCYATMNRTVMAELKRVPK